MEKIYFTLHGAPGIFLKSALYGYKVGNKDLTLIINSVSVTASYADDEQSLRDTDILTLTEIFDEKQKEFEASKLNVEALKKAFSGELTNS